MPMTLTAAKTPKGHRYLHSVASGDVTAEDAKGLNLAIAPGGPLADLGILGVVQPGANFSAEARQALTSGGNQPGAASKPVAIVVTSAPLRVMLGFIIRISGSGDFTRFFSVEAEALAWLDERLGAPPA